eukprot:TRINITY_DN1659_c2_g1_i1.p1 TRINITY_DN1659_c2_g1~~TRINITY_DN1659_c2_g1_i1.p1  ORF type:complete len:239 (-),score=-33.92 TRINITY_DN1659_c2_g1_i1:352-1068(-)
MNSHNQKFQFQLGIFALGQNFYQKMHIREIQNILKKFLHLQQFSNTKAKFTKLKRHYQQYKQIKQTCRHYNQSEKICIFNTFFCYRILILTILVTHYLNTKIHFNKRSITKFAQYITIMLNFCANGLMSLYTLFNKKNNHDSQHKTFGQCTKSLTKHQKHTSFQQLTKKNIANQTKISENCLNNFEAKNFLRAKFLNIKIILRYFTYYNFDANTQLKCISIICPYIKRLLYNQIKQYS